MSDATVEAAPQKPEAPELAESFESLFFEGAKLGPYLLRFTVLIVLSSTIAAFGLLADSAAVVIGAMLVAPLMTPILATAAAMTMNESRRLLHSIAVLFFGTVLAVAVGWAVSALASSGFADDSSLPSQVLARTSPNLLDLGIAVAAGAVPLVVYKSYVAKKILMRLLQWRRAFLSASGRAVMCVWHASWLLEKTLMLHCCYRLTLV